MTSAAPRRRLYALCPMHGVRFPIKGLDGPIECNVSPHTLTDHYPNSGNQFIEQCPSCDTIWPFSPASPAKQCVYCGTSFGQRSLCKDCSVFTLMPNGVASIACAGCGALRHSEHGHHCPESGLFTTARAECPFCLESLVPVGPVEVPSPDVPRRASAPKIAAQPVEKVPVGEPNPPRPESFEPQPQPQVPRTKAPSRALLYGAIALLAVIGVVVYFSYTDFPSRIDRALAANRYFSPDQDSVYDIYNAEAAKHPDSAEVKAAAAKIVAKLGPESDEQLSSFYRDSDAKDWVKLARSYGFLEVLMPADNVVKTKHAYADGQRLLVEDHNYARALESFHRALSFDSRFVLAINGIAKIYIQDSSPLHNEAVAVQSYQDAIAADPNFTWAPKNLGEYYMQKEQWQTAESYMGRALQTSPQRPSILAALGRIAFNRRNYVAAQDYYLRAIKVASKPEDLKKYNHALEQIREKL